MKTLVKTTCPHRLLLSESAVKLNTTTIVIPHRRRGSAVLENRLRRFQVQPEDRRCQCRLKGAASSACFFNSQTCVSQTQLKSVRAAQKRAKSQIRMHPGNTMQTGATLFIPRQRWNHRQLRRASLRQQGLHDPRLPQRDRLSSQQVEPRR